MLHKQGGCELTFAVSGGWAGSYWEGTGSAGWVHDGAAVCLSMRALHGSRVAACALTKGLSGSTQHLESWMQMSFAFEFIVHLDPLFDQAPVSLVCGDHTQAML